MNLTAKLIREYVRELVSEAPSRKKLRIFDFDDTLVKTKSLIHVTASDGKKFDLTPGEFAVYSPAQGDVFDFTDFSKLIDPTEIKWTVKILRNILTGGSEVVVLTARGSHEPVHQFLEEAGLPSLTVVALGDADPKKKAAYVAKRIEEDGFDFVEFFDDSYKNIAAVNAIAANYPETKIVTRHVVHRTEIS